MFRPLLLTFRQIGDPAFVWPLLKGCLAAAAVFLGLAALGAWVSAGLAGGEGWLAGIAGALGGLAAFGLAIWLFVPAVLALTGLFLDPVAAAVEQRFYPDLPPAAGAGLGAQAWAGLSLALRFGLLSLLALPLGLLVPPLGAVLLWLISAIALGHGLFEGVAQRRHPVAESKRLRRQLEVPVLALGAVFGGLALLPGINLLVPVLGTAAMTHLLHADNRGTASRIG
ncbi:EI24 domain-containing protein [Siccirubricoccus sp. KC 17139]|uniref:EI24 domain-containing protein n=1 Tax=Siccirubricoccus soli TaxID=2899147 RepID=A0ABT1D430_9PROT|nr:EI24 domain-containing protein [Siccirubricoccus soli]MCO6416629.1 EI24 domain-containing protein [Siccirubricoccus soli]MCP2682764.1 EI24 domain-containing protein [Siccirubricoccus soli]